jgi:hypothetical protein
MIRLVRPKIKYKSSRYDEDVVRLQEAAKALGYVVTKEDMRAAWESWSESFAAGWLGLPEGARYVKGSSPDEAVQEAVKDLIYYNYLVEEME